jgi:hypothetical protein
MLSILLKLPPYLYILLATYNIHYQKALSDGLNCQEAVGEVTQDSESIMFSSLLLSSLFA